MVLHGISDNTALAKIALFISPILAITNLVGESQGDYQYPDPCEVLPARVILNEDKYSVSERAGEENRHLAIFKDFISNIVEDSIDMEPEMIEIVSRNFWNLF